MKRIVFLLFLFCAAQTITAQHLCKQRLLETTNQRGTDEQLRSVASQNTDVKHYRCFFENTPNVRNIKGFVVVSFRAVTDASSIVFDLKSNLTVDSVKQGNNAANLSFTRPTDAVQITLGNTVAANAVDSVKIFYQGNPLTNDGYFATGTHSGAPITYTLSQPYGARYWWPCKDDVVDKADSITITLKYPLAYTGVSNGVLTSEMNDGVSKFSTWKHKHPIAAYLAAFAISNYTKQTATYIGAGGAINLVNYVYPESMSSYTANIAKLNPSFAAFEAKFGPYPYRNEQYTQTQIQNGVGGMEHQTNSFIDSWNDELMAHELMHQWFGDYTTCNTWKDIWLNEGFASYGEVLYLEQVNGFTAAVNEMKARTNSVNSATTGTVYRTDTSSVGSIFNYRLTYLKASYAVHMLRWQLGDTKFYEQCRSYLNAPDIKNSFVTTDSLKKYMEAGLPIGSNNLTEYFNDYVFGQGYPSYQIEWNQVGNNVVVKANQTSANPIVSFYEMPIPVKLISASRDTTVRLTHTTNGQLFNFPLSFTVQSVQFDPEAWILSRNNTVAQNAALAPTAISNIVNDPNIKLGRNGNMINIIAPANTRFKTIECFAVDGRLLQSTNTKELNTSGFSEGKYIVKMYHSDGKISVRSFVK